MAKDPQKKFDKVMNLEDFSTYAYGSITTVSRLGRRG